MSPKHLIVASVIASMFSASAGTAFAQARPPAFVPPPVPAPAAAPAVPAPYPPPAAYPPPYPYQGPYYPPPPPPASAVAPNGEYVAPLSQTTQPTYVPQSVALSGPRMIRDWQEGMPIPHGYHQETRARRGLVIAGSIVFGVTYIYTSLIAAAGEESSGQNELGSLWVPVLGPFMQMAETDSPLGNYVLLLDGLAQAAGVTMLVAGLVYPRHVLVRNDLASMTVVPMKIGMEGSGLGVVGRF
jgi:hypothetical protein